MTRLTLSTLAIAAVLAAAVTGSAPAEAKKKKSATMGAAPAAASGTVNTQDLHFSKILDKATPARPAPFQKRRR
jgi:hypothetical protein